MRDLMRRLRNAWETRPRCPIKNWPSVCLACLAILSMWFTFFLFAVLNGIRPLIVEAIVTGVEPSTPAAIVVISVATLMSAYLWFFGSLLRLLTGELHRRWFE